jgi:hypothetical protein
LYPYGIVPVPNSEELAISTTSSTGSIFYPLAVLTSSGTFTLFSIPSKYGNGGGGGPAFRTPSDLWLPNSGATEANILAATFAH